MESLKEILNNNGINFLPPEEILNRIDKLKFLLQKKEILEAVIFSKVNNYYFTGTNQEQILIVYASKPPLLLVKRDIHRASLESPIETVNFSSFQDLKKFISSKNIGVEFNYITAKQYLKLKSFLSDNLIDITNIIREIRSIKSNFELKLMKKAASIAEKVYIEALNYLKEGITEIEFGSIMFSLAQKFGHEGVLRTGSIDFNPVSWHILSGISGNIHGQYDAPASGIGMSPSFPNSASRKKILKGEPVMVDFGICYYGYQVDSTRMYCIGEPDEKFQSFYNSARKIEKHILTKVKIDATGDFLYNEAIKEAKAIGVFNEFLGIGKNKKKFIGHGVGLETSESPLLAKNSKDKISERMTFAIEPKFVINNFGIVGIENSVVVLNNKIEKITKISEDILIV